MIDSDELTEAGPRIFILVAVWVLLLYAILTS